jgi:hypothetical protein
MSLIRVFDVMCWMFSWEGEHGPCSQGTPSQNEPSEDPGIN